MWRVCLMVVWALAVLPGYAVAGWDDYDEQSQMRGQPRATLLLAQRYFNAEGRQAGLALDLGAGAGNDTLFLLQQGWQVLAIDKRQQALEIIVTRAAAEQLQRLQVLTVSFADLALAQQYDLINASYSLPFCRPEHFTQLWQQISDHLTVGGRFCGQFFGERDAWKDDAAMTFITLEQLQELFRGRFEIEYLQIEEGKLPSAAAPLKQWHLFHVIAKKVKETASHEGR